MRSTARSHQSRLSGRAISVVAATVLAILLLFGFSVTIVTSAYAEDADGTDKGGYWQLSGAPVVVSDEEPQNSPIITEKRERKASTLEHSILYAVKYTDVTTPDHWNWVTDSWVGDADPDEEDVRLEEAEFVATCSSPPEKVAADDYVTLHLTLELRKNTCEGYYCEAHASALHGTDDRPLDGKDASAATAGMSPFGPATDDGPDACSIATRPSSSMEEQVGACDVKCQLHDPEAPQTSVLSFGEPSTSVRIAFDACGSATIWTYEWVPRKEGGEWEEVVTPYKDQTEKMDASKNPGKQGSPTIDDDIIGNDEEFDPTWIVVPASIVTIGGVTYALWRRRRRTPNDPRPDESARARYNMVLYKEFGDTMVPGQTYRVGACIDRQQVTATGMPVGPAVPDAQKSSAIRPVGVQNIRLVAPPAYVPPYMMATVQVPEQPTNITSYPPAILRFSYAGVGGTFNAQVSFKVKANARIEFCDEHGDTISRSKTVIDLLAGDMRGVTCYFEAVDFTERPQVTSDISDGRLQATITDHVVPARPTGFYYKVEMRWTELPFNEYDSWPYPAYMDIHARTRTQQADGRVEAKAWYDGIGIDIKHLDTGRQFAGDAIIINTAKFMETAEADYNISDTKVGVVAAFRNRHGEVEVFAPNNPKAGDFARIEGDSDDPDALRIFSKDDPRFWYDLTLVRDPQFPSTDDHRIGTVTVKPFFPLLLEDETQGFRGSLALSYRDEEEGVEVKGSVSYIVRGMDEGGYLETREQEIKAIARILAGMNATGMQEAYSLLEKYGGQSERARMRLGNDERREALAKTSASIMAKVNNIHSVQRLRFMRQELFNAAVAYNKNDGLTIAGVNFSWQELADYADSAYKIALLSRWATDIMFTVWWYMVLKTKAAYVEPVMTPLKNWLLDYCEMLGTFALDPDEEWQTIEQFFSARNYYYKVLVPTIEGEFFSIVVAQAATHGTALITTPQGLTLVGSVFAFMFANQCMVNAKRDKRTGKIEIDFWDALKKTTVKMTKFTLKVVLSVILARKFFDMFKTSTGRPPVPFPDAQTAREKMLNCLHKGLGDVMAPLTKNIKNDWGKGGLSWIEDTLAQEEAVDFVQAVFADAPMGYVIDGPKDIENWNGDAPKGTNGMSWLRSFGEIIPVDVIDETTGQPQTVYVPILTGAYIFIDDLLTYLGVDELRCLSVDYSTVLPDECPYKTRDEMIRLLRERRIMNEAEWLAQPHYEVAGNYVGPSMDDRDSMVPQTIYHPIMR